MAPVEERAPRRHWSPNGYCWAPRKPRSSKRDRTPVHRSVGASTAKTTCADPKIALASTKCQFRRQTGHSPEELRHGLLWVDYCRPWTSPIRWLNLRGGFPALRSCARPAQADPVRSIASVISLPESGRPATDTRGAPRLANRAKPVRPLPALRGCLGRDLRRGRRKCPARPDPAGRGIRRAFVLLRCSKPSSKGPSG
jgi:hypothetical protein